MNLTPAFRYPLICPLGKDVWLIFWREFHNWSSHGYFCYCNFLECFPFCKPALLDWLALSLESSCPYKVPFGSFVFINNFCECLDEQSPGGLSLYQSDDVSHIVGIWDTFMETLDKFLFQCRENFWGLGLADGSPSGLRETASSRQACWGWGRGSEV